MPVITLYNFELDEGCYRARLLLSMLGVEFEAIAVDMVPGAEHLTPAMLALSPRGTLPILMDGDFVLTGTTAILTYLARSHDTAGTWLPTTPKRFGLVMSWLEFSSRELAGAKAAREVCLLGAAGDEDSLRAQARAALRLMDDHMTKRSIAGFDWFVGDTPTLADLALMPAFALSRDYGLDHDEFPALRRWLRRFRALKGFHTMPGIPDYH